MKIEITFLYDLNELLVKPVNISKVCELGKNRLLFSPLRNEKKPKKTDEYLILKFTLLKPI